MKKQDIKKTAAEQREKRPLTEEERKRRARIIRRRREERIRKRKIMMVMTVAALLLVLGGVAGIFAAVKNHNKKIDGAKKEENQQEESAKALDDILVQAERMALQYDYDGAIELLKGQSEGAASEEIKAAIGKYEKTKETLVERDPEDITHVFYHSLVVDPKRGFAGTTGAQFNMWMTTLSEFNKINESMYEKGYVLVRMRDMVVEKKDAQGNVTFEKGKIMLPPDKKPFIMSLDDLSYYHSYDKMGIASKLILDSKGKVTNEYIEADGNTVTGSYDCVPLLDDFVQKHPDFSYKGAKGMIALTGYNGVLGYRTDQSYEDKPEDLDTDKVEWLEAHPDFNLEAEKAEAKKVAEAMKEQGWEFASHTWGHQYIGDISFESLKTDTQKWMDNVAPLVGGTDTIIFAHGQDIVPEGEYTSDTEKYTYLKSLGYNYYCTVDSREYTTNITENYVHQGRRNLDGYRMYHNPELVDDLFDAKAVFDSGRPTPVATQ